MFSLLLLYYCVQICPEKKRSFTINSEQKKKPYRNCHQICQVHYGNSTAESRFAFLISKDLIRVSLLLLIQWISAIASNSTSARLSTCFFCDSIKKRAWMIDNAWCRESISICNNDLSLNFCLWSFKCYCICMDFSSSSNVELISLKNLAS